MEREVNKQNVRRYGPQGEKPEVFIHTTNKFPKKVMVFLDLHWYRIVFVDFMSFKINI